MKIGASYCADAFPITFIKDTADVYGRGIDLTARLLQRASANEILMNEAFFNQVSEEYERQGRPVEYAVAGEIKGPWPEKLKGFPEPVVIFKWCGYLAAAGS